MANTVVNDPQSPQRFTVKFKAGWSLVFKGYEDKTFHGTELVRYIVTESDTDNVEGAHIYVRTNDVSAVIVW